jgi:hypothetical protein
MRNAKIFSVGIFLSFQLFLFIPETRAQANDSLYKLYKSKQFLELDQYNSNTKQPLYYFYKALYSNACNQPARSNQELNTFMQGKKDPPITIAYEYWTVRGDNYIKLFDYKNAAAVQRMLLKNFRERFDKEAYEGEINAVKIWESLIHEKAQRIIQPPATQIPLTHDLAGLINIKVNAAGTDTNFVFDTGAGMSSITESLAKKLKFRFMPDTGIKVSGFNGIYNPVRIAVADELKIGDIIVRNEPFLVFQDEALSFAGGAYKINGIIGFPIAKGLGSITIAKDHLKIDGSAIADAAAHKNLFVEQLRPILFMQYRGKNLPFNFDTGANISQFSKTFYDHFGAELEKSGKVETNRFASAGGAKETKVLVVQNVKFASGQHEVIFPEIRIDLENYHVSGNELFGNIGQDLLKRYKEVTISFTGNYLKLVN